MKKCLLIIVFLCLIPFTYVQATDDKILSADVYSSEEMVSKVFNYDNDLELYTNTRFSLSFEEDSTNNYYFYASEYSEKNIVQFQKEENKYVSEEITVNKSGKYTILILSDDPTEFYTIDLIVYDSIETVTLVSTDNYPLIGENIDVKVVYNNSETVLPVTNISWSLNDESLSNDLIEERNSTSLLLKPFMSKQTISLKAVVDDISSNLLSLEVSDLEIASSFTVIDDSKAFLKSDEYGYINALIPKDSKPEISLYDNTYSVRYDSFTKEAYDDEFDLVKIKIELIKENKFTITLTCKGLVNGENTIFAKNVECEIVDVLTSFIITVNKEEIGLGERAELSATVNESNSLDTNILWYVDNELIDIHDYSFEYEFRNGGDHYVYAMINDVKSNEISLFVNYTRVEVLIWYSLLGFSLCFGIPAIIFITKKHGSSRIRGISNKLKDILVVFKGMEKKYKKTKNKDEIKFNFRKMINRLNSLLNDADYESHMHKEAVYDELKKNIARSRKIVEVIVKMYDEKTNKEVAKLINDVNTYISRSLENIDSIEQLERTIRNKKK